APDGLGGGLVSAGRVRLRLDFVPVDRHVPDRPRHLARHLLRPDTPLHHPDRPPRRHPLTTDPTCLTRIRAPARRSRNRPRVRSRPNPACLRPPPAEASQVLTKWGLVPRLRGACRHFGSNSKRRVAPSPSPRSSRWEHLRAQCGPEPVTPTRGHAAFRIGGT